MKANRSQIEPPRLPNPEFAACRWMTGRQRTIKKPLIAVKLSVKVMAFCNFFFTHNHQNQNITHLDWWSQRCANPLLNPAFPRCFNSRMGWQNRTFVTDFFVLFNSLGVDDVDSHSQPSDIWFETTKMTCEDGRCSFQTAPKQRYEQTGGNACEDFARLDVLTCDKSQKTTVLRSNPQSVDPPFILQIHRIEAD